MKSAHAAPSTIAERECSQRKGVEKEGQAVGPARGADGEVGDSSRG
eukprot:CAMPEP_0177615408 /NCGR_PEP_ID=MMETSP0419_2-20121207/23423_1 /TAXON_ID=582737 /ORGANISM="Tetraselmis sp., Strain GSL018" /LENGTH=45 /DNA_ID= /DNA_START= /DNA_END= /DNA_ORIENTATION=